MFQSIQLKGGNSHDMLIANPLLKRREIAVEVDSGKIKVGDGISLWNDLPYAGNFSALKHATKSTWAELNPVLDLAEPALELYSFNIKIGDGVSHWNDLPYVIHTGLDDSPLRINSQFIPDAAYKSPFSFSFSATGAVAPSWSCVRLEAVLPPDDSISYDPIAFSIDELQGEFAPSRFLVPVDLPEGLSFDHSLATLSGSPNEKGNFELKVSVSDGGVSVHKLFSFRVL